MSDIEMELRKLENGITKAESNLAKDEGSEETLMEQLKEYGVTSLEDGEEMMIAIGEDINKIEDGIEEKLEKLIDIYNY
jgi:hypothetical protein